MIIDTNISALFAENAVQNTTNQLQQIQQELATGYQINSPADNPAGLAIADLMNGELGGLTSATQNAHQAVNLLQTANGGVQTDIQIVQEIQQLAVQASNGTETTQDQQDIQAQINSLLQQLDNNAQSINYNNLTLLNGQFGATVQYTAASGAAVTSVVLGPDGGQAATGAYSVTIASVAPGVDSITVTNAAGTQVAYATVAVPSSGLVTAQLVEGVTASTALQGSLVVTFNAASVAAASGGTVTALFTVVPAAESMSFQVGPAQGPQNVVNAALGAFTSVSLGLANINVVGQSNAQTAISLAQNALSMLTNAQGQIGAHLDELQYTINNLQTEQLNLQAAQSTIMDANMAQVSSAFAQEQVLQQTGLQALATANQLPTIVLRTLGL